VKKYFVRIEVLVWNTRLRMQRGGGGVSINFVGFLKGTKTKPASTPSGVGGGVGLFTKQGSRIVIVAILFEDAPHEHQLGLQAIFIT
jgi:hypothetical protein